MAKTKVQISIDSDLLDQIDDYCDRNYMNRSWFISHSCVQLLNQQKVIDAISSISCSIKRCVDNGHLDDDTKRELQNFETLVELYSRK